MDEGGFSLGDANIAIIGLGLMGGSLALSLKKHCRKLSALDPHVPTLALARRRNIVDVADSDPEKILADADLVVLACPVPAILDWVQCLPDYVQHPCIVIDIGSTKRAIVTAFDTLPDNFDPIGGHAICGRERLSLENAVEDLYQNAPFVLISLARTSQKARNAALQLVSVVGAEPLWLSAAEHDRFLASTSHLPYLISSALALATTEEARPFVGPGFRSASRLAGTPISMMLGVLLSNQDNILAAVQQFQEQLSKIEYALHNNDSDQLEALLQSSRRQFQALIQ